MARGWMVDSCAVGTGIGLVVLYQSGFTLEPNPIMRILLSLGLLALPLALVAAARVVARRDYARIGTYALVLGAPATYIVGEELRRAKVAHLFGFALALLPLALGVAISLWARRMERRRVQAAA